MGEENGLDGRTTEYFTVTGHQKSVVRKIALEIILDFLNETVNELIFRT
jgi:hypothetical protein